MFDKEPQRFFPAKTIDFHETQKLIRKKCENFAVHV